MLFFFAPPPPLNGPDEGAPYKPAGERPIHARSPGRPLCLGHPPIHPLTSRPLPLVSPFLSTTSL